MPTWAHLCSDVFTWAHWVPSNDFQVMQICCFEAKGSGKLDISSQNHETGNLLNNLSKTENIFLVFLNWPKCIHYRYHHYYAVIGFRTLEFHDIIMHPCFWSQMLSMTISTAVSRQLSAASSSISCRRHWFITRSKLYSLIYLT